MYKVKYIKLNAFIKFVGVFNSKIVYYNYIYNCLLVKLK